MRALKTMTVSLLLGTTLAAAVIPATVYAAGASQLQVAQSKKTHWKTLTPTQAVKQFKADIQKDPKNGQAYGECYPSSGEGGEDCSVFLAICDGVGGGSGSLPGGGYSCDYRQD